MRYNFYILVMYLALSLTGCHMQNLADYKAKQPELLIQNYLNNHSTAWGMVKNWRGKVVRRFNVDITGSWHDNQGVLHEEFTYDDGEKQQRVWQIKMQDKHHFTATADDIIGTASGEQLGNTIHIQYTLKLPSGTTVNIDDWLYAINHQVVLNQSQIKKFGMPVGSLFIAFNKD